MEELIELIIVIGGLSILGFTLFFVFQILRLKLRKLKKEVDGDTSTESIDDLKKDIGYLMAENEEMKEELRNIKYLLSQGKDLIDIKNYEEEQIRIDQQNKFNS